jgi:hypothetical protein
MTTLFNIFSIQVAEFKKGYGDFINKLLTSLFIPLSSIGKRF